MKISGAYSSMPDRWYSHNCNMCHVVGPHRPDTKSRGGLKFTSTGGIGYNCFNCRFTTRWEPGQMVGKKLVELAQNYGATPDDIATMVLYAKSLIDSGVTAEQVSSHVYAQVIPKPLPVNANTLSYWATQQNVPLDFNWCIQQIYERNPALLKLPILWTPDKDNDLNKRFIVPYIMNGKPVGYTARHCIKNVPNRFVNSFPSNIIFNFDLLNNESVKNIYVFEAPIDALLMGGVAISSQKMSQYQLDILTRVRDSGKRVIIVPDHDSDGKKMAMEALDNGFDISLPVFGKIDGKVIKDPEESVSKYGRLITKTIIVNSTMRTKFEAKVMMNKWWV